MTAHDFCSAPTTTQILSKQHDNSFFQLHFSYGNTPAGLSVPAGVFSVLCGESGAQSVTVTVAVVPEARRQLREPGEAIQTGRAVELAADERERCDRPLTVKAAEEIAAQVAVHKRDACERGFVQRDQQLAARAVRERDVLQLCQRAQFRHVCAVEVQRAHIHSGRAPSAP